MQNGKPKGGIRPGSGRKKGSLSVEQKTKQLQESLAREHMVKSFLADWEKTEQTIKKLAYGELKMFKVGGKEFEVCTEKPDAKMLQLIVETVIGRPKQEVGGSLDMNMPELLESNKILRQILEKK